MKNARILVTMLAVAVAAGFVASPAVANCIPAKTGANFAFPYYSYIDFDDATGDNSHFIGAFWQTTAPDSSNNNTYSVQEWLYGVPGFTYYWYFYLNLGDARVTGCAENNLTVYIEDTLTDKFILWTADEGAGPSFNFDYDFTNADRGAANKDGTDDGFFVAGDSPRPRIQSSNRSGTNVDVNLNVPDPNAGHYTQGGTGAISEVRIYSQSSATTPPSDLPGAWVQVGTLGPGGGAGSVTVDCSNTSEDQYVAAALVVEGLEPRVVSEASLVECDPNLADPSGRIKRLPKGERPHKVRGL